MLLLSTIFLPLLGASFIFFIDNKKSVLIKKTGLFFSGLTFCFSLFIWFLFDSSSSDYQFLFE